MLAAMQSESIAAINSTQLVINTQTTDRQADWDSQGHAVSEFKVSKLAVSKSIIPMCELTKAYKL